MPARGSSDREVAEFWDTHSVADYWDELEPIELRRRSAPRRVVTLRLDPRAVEALRVIARRRGIEYSALARSWITDRLRDEIRKASARSR
jgi:hypothetical protein